jgi:hypothetical protein
MGASPYYIDVNAIVMSVVPIILLVFLFKALTPMLESFTAKTA